MNIEIKFRAKAINNDYYKKGTWVYGSLLVFKGFSIFDSLFKNWVDVDGKTKGQYTGREDNNGVEIYYGDIVRIYGGEQMFGYYEFDKVKVIKELEDIVMLSNVDCGIEVIGNIYDNPELLEVEDDK